MARKWRRFPHANDAYDYDTAAFRKQWPRLHRGDTEPYPANSEALDAWRCYHAGEFQKAVVLGTAAKHPAGANAAVKAQTVYAVQLEPDEAAKLKLLEEAAGWADATRKAAPGNANAHYLYAFALGRYGQGISVAKALARGFGGKIKDALGTALELAPAHAEAHTAYGTYQAEVIDKVGALVGGMTYGVKKESAIEHFEAALKLFPESPIAHLEYANGLLRLFGKARIDDATRLYQKASALRPMDAMERLDVEIAKSELE